jgi:ATP-binding cassette subfamily B protein
LDNAPPPVPAPTPASGRRLANLLPFVQTLRPFLGRYRALVAAWLAFLFVSSAASLVLPYAVRQMIDPRFFGGERGRDRPVLPRAARAWPSCSGLATACRFYFISLLGERVVADVRRKLYSHLVTLDLAFFETTRTGELQSPPGYRHGAGADRGGQLRLDRGA